jgi:hypothetical protein
LILRALLKAALRHVFVNFRAANFRSATHDVDRCFLAAFELAHDLIDDAIVEQWL